MAIADKTGRSYARLSDLHAGDKVKVDGGFGCLESWSVHTVQQDAFGSLYISCAAGEHHLSGQSDGDGYLVGMYHVKP